jgi:hypothetical protein
MAEIMPQPGGRVRVGLALMLATHSRSEALVVCAALAPLVLAGCGKSERQRFADRGNEVCRAIGPGVQAGQRRIQAAKGQAATAAGIEQMTAAARAGRTRFSRIQAPKELRADYAAFLHDLDGLLPLLSGLKQAVSESDVGRARALETRIERLSTRAQPLSKRLGLDACGGAR